MRTLREINAQLKHSSTLRRILQDLQRSRKNFVELKNEVGVTSRTLSKHLKRAIEEGLVKHTKRNEPYEITPRGVNFLKMTETRPVDDFAIDFVRSGDFSGSIVFRVPKKFARVFNSLYQPKPLEGLRRAFLVGFEFWVNRYGGGAYSGSTGQRTGGTIAFGRDFNNDKIWDLAMYETPASGYPNIKKALKKGEFVLDGKRCGISSASLWKWGLNSLEKRLQNASFRSLHMGTEK